MDGTTGWISSLGTCFLIVLGVHVAVEGEPLFSGGFDECRLWIGQVRHPNVLAFLHSTEAETMDGGVLKPTIYLVTEPVMPLSEKIQELDLQGTQRYTLLLDQKIHLKVEAK